MKAIRRIIDLMPHARYVSIDTEFFYGLDLCMPSFLTPEAFYDRYVEHHRDQHIAQLGITIALPEGINKDDGSLAAETTATADSKTVQANNVCTELGLPQLFDSTFKHAFINTKVEQATKFSPETFGFLKSSGFSLDTWIDTAIEISTHPQSIVDRCTAFWSQLFAAIDALHGARGFTDAKDAMPSRLHSLNPRIMTSTAESSANITKQGKQDALGIGNKFIAAAVHTIGASRNQKYTEFTSGGSHAAIALYETAATINYNDIFDYIETLLNELQREDLTLNSDKKVEYFITITPTNGHPYAVVPDYLQLLRADIEALTGASPPNLLTSELAKALDPSSPLNTCNNRYSKVNPKVTLEVKLWGSREDAQMYTHSVTQKLRSEMYGLRALMDAMHKHNVPLITYAGYADVYLTLASIYGRGYLSTYSQFRALIQNTFTRFFDLKILIDLPPIISHLKNNLGLNSRALSKIFEVTSHNMQTFQQSDDYTSAHNAGYDSLITALSFEWIIAHILIITSTVAVDTRHFQMYKGHSKATRDLIRENVPAFLTYSWNKLYVHLSAFPYSLKEPSMAYSTADQKCPTLTQYILYPVKNFSLVTKALAGLSTALKAKYPDLSTHFYIDRNRDYGKLYIATTHPEAQTILSDVLAAEESGVSYAYVNTSIAELHTLQYAQKHF